jgi:hypothetical protein
MNSFQFLAFQIYCLGLNQIPFPHYLVEDEVFPMDSAVGIATGYGLDD